MARKVYGIIFNEYYVYVPIKSPVYDDGKHMYCSCTPNFFGGRANAHEEDRQVLEREIMEESQNNIQPHAALVDASRLTLLHNAAIENKRTGATDDYYFYSLSIAGADVVFRGFENGIICLLSDDASLYNHTQREFQSIVRISKVAFAEYTGDEALINRLMLICEGYMERGNPFQKKAGKEDFNCSETKKAFKAFFANWLA